MLYTHQERLVSVNPKKHLLLWETGTGKTLAAIAWATKNGPHLKKLVVCPKMLVENWKRQVDDSFTVISKERFRKFWRDLPRYQIVIIDEVHNHAGHTSQLHKATVAYLRNNNVEFILGLTATPYSQPWNVFGLAAIMGRPMNWMTFRRTFFFEVRMGFRTIPRPKPKMDDKLIGILHMFGSTMKLDECVDMPESVYEQEHFTLTHEQEKLVRMAYDPLPIVRFTREHQIAGGTLKGDEYEVPMSFDCPKKERLIGLAHEHKKMIVVCRYLHEMKALEKALTGRPVYLLSGETPNRDELIQKLKGADEYCLIVQAQCSEGWELPDCPVMVFYSMSWRFIDRVQMEGRIRRISNPKRNLYVDLIVSKSADSAVYDAISKRQDFQVKLYDEREGLPGKTHEVGQTPPV